mmetsp:Transcript_117240/g.203646  ORF Transcript_117240/g.203646 Transcript_117240/m.203646 type:complete len:235 (+) Transcript_117240:308-1012(+)
MGSLRYFTARDLMASSTCLSAPAFSQRKQNWLSLGPQSPAWTRSLDHSLKLATGPAFLPRAITLVNQSERTSFLKEELNFSVTAPTSLSVSICTTPGILTSNSRCSSFLKTPFLSQRSTTPMATLLLNSRLNAFHIGGTSLLSLKSTTAGRFWLSFHSRICRLSESIVEKSFNDELTNLLRSFVLMSPSKTSGGDSLSSGNHLTAGKSFLSIEAERQVFPCCRQLTDAILTKSL